MFKTLRYLAFMLTDVIKNVHCIGDKANHVVLDIFEEIIQKRGANVSDWRPRIEHAQIFSPEDLDRIAKLGGKSLQNLRFV